MFAFGLTGDANALLPPLLACSVSDGLERLPVVTDLRSRRLIGVVSRSDLVKPVQAQLDEDVHRERTLGWVRRG